MIHTQRTAFPAMLDTCNEARMAYMRANARAQDALDMALVGVKRLRAADLHARADAMERTAYDAFHEARGSAHDKYARVCREAGRHYVAVTVEG